MSWTKNIVVVVAVVVVVLLSVVINKLKEKKIVVTTAMKKNNRRFKLLFDDISKQYNEMNRHSLWLLIATIGCWGIPDDNVQAIAMSIVVIIALYQISSLNQRMIRNNVRFNLIKDMYGKHLTVGRLKKFKRKKRQVIIQKVWIYVLCMVFVLISVYCFRKSIRTIFEFSFYEAFR